MHRQSSPRIFLFFAIALGWTLTLHGVVWLAQRGVIAGPPERFMPLLGLGAFGPLIAALVASRAERRPMYRRLPSGSFAAGFYAIALLLFPTIYLVGVAVHALFAGRPPRVLYLPESKEHLVGMALMPLLEEPAWRGYALPRLQERYTRPTASILLGAAWAVWHTGMFLIAGIGLTPAMFLLLYANIFVGSFAFTWLFNRTAGSLLIAVTAHVSVHINNPTHALPANPTPFVVYTAAIAVFVIATMVLDRRAWQGLDPVAPRPRAHAAIDTP